MDYFKDVYLKQINRFGDNLQARVQNKMKYDFSHYLSKTPNKVIVSLNEEKFEGAFQNKVNSELEVIYYLLLNRELLLDNGTVLTITNPVDGRNSIWMIFYLEDKIASGYNRYKVIKVDDVFEINGKKIYGHILRANEPSLKSEFRIQYESSGAYIPSKHFTAILQDDESFQRGNKINIQNETWIIKEVDRISNAGLIYIYFEQTFDENTLDSWDITWEYGSLLEFNSTTHELDFNVYKNGILMDEPISVDTKFFQYQNAEIAPIDSTKSQKEFITVYLTEKPYISKIFTVFYNKNLSDKNIIGDNTIPFNETRIYTTNFDLDNSYNITTGNNEFILKDKNTIAVKGTNIGIFNIIIKNGQETISKIVTVTSPWEW